jgi:hypothetical protein
MVRALKEGFLRTWQLRPLLMLFWLINLLIAVLFLRPYLKSFDEFFMNRLVTDVLAHRNIYTFYAEFYHYMSSLVGEAMNPLRSGLLVQYIVFLLLSGGFITYYYGPEKVHYGEFFLRSLRTMWPMFKMTVFIPFILLTGTLLAFLLILPLGLLVPEPAVESRYFFLLITAGIIWGLVMLLFLLLLDLTRVRVIYYSSDSVVLEFFKTVRYFLKHPVRYYGLYLILVLLWIGTVTLYWIIQQLLDDTGLSALIIQLIILQVFMFLQIGIRVSRFGVLINFMQILEAEPARLRREVLEAHKMEYNNW